MPPFTFDSFHNREEFTRQLEALVKAIRPDDQDFTTIEHIRDGLAGAGAGRGGSKLDRDRIHETEWVGLRTLPIHFEQRERPTAAHFLSTAFYFVYFFS